MFYLIAKAATDAADSSGENPLVTCSGLDCTVCSLVQMVVNIFYYLTWYIAFPVAVLFLIIGGFIYIGSRGNDRWMSFAKRSIIYTLGGFMVAVLAFLAINTLVQVIGGSDNGIWNKFECSSDVATRIKDLNPKKSADLIKSAKLGGELSGKLANDTSADEILQMMNKLSPSDMIIFESELKGERKALMAVGKKNNQPELLFVDRATINRILSESQSSLLLNKAQAADTNSSTTIEELISQISQIVAKIIASNHDLFVIISGKPDNATSTTILNVIGKVDQCIETGGSWYRFSSICVAEQETCNATKCTPAGDNLVASCKCPSDKCLSNGQCISKTK